MLILKVALVQEEEKGKHLVCDLCAVDLAISESA